MTLTEFRDEVTWWGALKDFCYEHSCSACDDIMDDDSRDSYIESDVDYYSRNENWRDLSDYLYNLSGERYDWWCHSEYDGDWYEADEDLFTSRCEEVENWAIANGIIEDTEEADNEEAEEEPVCYTAQSEPEEPELEEEDCAIGEVFSDSLSVVHDELEPSAQKRREMRETIRAAAEASMAEGEAVFECIEEEENDFLESPEDIFEFLSA